MRTIANAIRRPYALLGEGLLTPPQELTVGLQFALLGSLLKQKETFGRSVARVRRPCANKAGSKDFNGVIGLQNVIQYPTFH
jgi:hypothetical protein